MYMYVYIYYPYVELYADIFIIETVAKLLLSSPAVEPFKEGQLSEIIVKKLLTQDVIHCIKLRTNKEQSRADQHTYIYMQVS